MIETIDPRDMPIMIHVIFRKKKWRVRWTDSKRALRVFSDEKEAIEWAKNKSKGEYSVMVHLPSGLVDVDKSIIKI